jgi:hypothetical protein
MGEDGILGLGILKGRRMGQPRTEEERAARHTRIFGEGSILPERGSGQGPAGLGIMNNIQDRMNKILKR